MLLRRCAELCCPCQRDPDHRALHSFPTRRSSDLRTSRPWPCSDPSPAVATTRPTASDRRGQPAPPRDRKSTTSELQSRLHLVCRLLLEKKNRAQQDTLLTNLDVSNYDGVRIASHY